MGLFGKKEPCPVCGGKTGGFFGKKIADKKTLCRECSAAVSMHGELLKTASPEYIKEHLKYRIENAKKYDELNWDIKYFVRGTKMGVDTSSGFIYIIDADMNDYDNPVLFPFESVTHYELYRLNKKLDDSDTPGELSLDGELSLLGSLARLTVKDSATDYFRLVLKTSDPYWPVVDLKIRFNTRSDVYGEGGFGRDMKKMCRVLKQIVRKETVTV